MIRRLQFSALFAILLLLGIVFLSGVVESFAGSRQGRRDAEEILKANRLVLKTSGLRQEWREEYERLLKVRYGIESEEFAGCVLDNYKSAYLAAYHELMMH